MRMKEAYKKKLQAQLDEWSTEIDRLKAKSNKAQADAQLEYYQEIDELRSMQEGARSKLSKLKKAGDDAWEELTAGIDNAWDTIGNNVKTITTIRKQENK